MCFGGLFVTEGLGTVIGPLLVTVSLNTDNLGGDQAFSTVDYREPQGLEFRLKCSGFSQPCCIIGVAVSSGLLQG